MDELLVLTRAVDFGAAICAFGTAAFRVYGLGEGEGEGGGPRNERFEAWLSRFVRIAATASLVAALVMLSCVTGEMAGSPAAALDPKMLATVLEGTRFGWVLCWHVGLVVALLFAAVLIPAASLLTLAFAAGALASLAWIGHAAMPSGWGGLGHELNQAVHLLAAGAWLGGLPALLRLLRTARHDGAALSRASVGYALSHFSVVGYVAVGLIAVTGIVNTMVLVGNLAALTGTAYGRLLMLKIALYLALVCLAVLNRFVLVPRLGSPMSDDTALRWLKRSVACEQAIGLLILLAVSVLGTWPPAIMAQPP